MFDLLLSKYLRIEVEFKDIKINQQLLNCIDVIVLDLSLGEQSLQRVESIQKDKGCFFLIMDIMGFMGIYKISVYILVVGR